MIISIGTDKLVPTSAAKAEYDFVEKIIRSLNYFANPLAICQIKEYNVFV